MHPTVTIATKAALAAGRIMLRASDRLDRLEVDSKGLRDWVSEVDVQAEREIVSVIRRHHPDHAILAEEGSEGGQSDQHQWIIDPLDGTTNYLHGFPQFAVSIAYRQRGRTEMGLIYDPLRQELFVASRGQGATLNERRLRVRSSNGLEGALLGTGFPARRPEHMPTYLAMFADLIDRCDEIRRAGAAALDLAYVAAGRLDGFWEIGLSPWDVAAGSLMVQEAGGLVGDFTGGHTYLEHGNIVAGSPKVFKAMLQTIQPHLNSGLRS